MSYDISGPAIENPPETEEDTDINMSKTLYRIVEIHNTLIPNLPICRLRRAGTMPVERNEALLCAVCREPVLEVYDSGGSIIGFVCSKCQLKSLAKDAKHLVLLSA
jgi:hypothetical protein